MNLWALRHGPSHVRAVVEEGYDARYAVLSHVTRDLVAYIGSDPLIQTNRKNVITPRNSPQPLAIEVLRSLRELVAEFDHPDFVHVEVGPISRLEQGNHRRTVVPVTLTLLGLQPLTLAWDAEVEP